MHEVHAFGYIQGHLVPLFESDVWNRCLLLMEHFEQSAAVTKLCDYDWVPLICCCTHEEHKVWVADVSQCLNLPLKLNAQLPVDDQALDFELLHGDICELVLCLIDDCSSSFSNLLEVCQFSEINLQELPPIKCIIKELTGQIPLLIVEIWLKSLFLRGLI